MEVSAEGISVKIAVSRAKMLLFWLSKVALVESNLVVSFLF